MKTRICLLAWSVVTMAACGEDSSPESAPVQKTLRKVPAAAVPVPIKPAKTPAKGESSEEIKQALLGLTPMVVDRPAREASPKAARRRIQSTQRKAKEEAGDAAFDAFAAGALGPVGLSDSEFQSTIGEWKGLSRCLAQSAGRMTDRSGALELAFSIMPDGSVAKCDVVRAGSAAAQAIAPCVAQKARRMRFPSFGGSEATERTAKFVF